MSVLSQQAREVCALIDHDPEAVIDPEEYGAALKELRELGIIVENPYREGKWLLHDPQHIWRSQVERGLAEIAAAVSRLEYLPRLLAHLPKQAGGGYAGIRLLSRGEASQALLRAEADARSYIWTAQPVDRPVNTMTTRIPLDVRNLQKGIALQTIYLERARTQPHMIEWATAVTEAGAQVRTLAKPFLRMIIIDGVVAVVSDYRNLTLKGEPDRDTAVLVTHPEMIAFLSKVYLLQWREAQPWLSGHDRRVPATAISPRQREIIIRLTDGKTQEVIGKELGLSPRTIRVEMAKLYALYGVEGEFALGRAIERADRNLRRRLKRHAAPPTGQNPG